MNKNIQVAAGQALYNDTPPKTASLKYVVIIPAKNEQNNIGMTLSSLAKQTVKPQCVLVVDNDSTDKTQDVIREYSERYPFIKYYNYKNPQEQKYHLGGKIVKIFNAGKSHLDHLGFEYDYIVKLDADIQLDKDIFEKISYRIRQDNYGIISPQSFSRIKGKIIYTSTPSWHTSGDFKVYNRACYEAMGGPKEDLGWDCADNISAMDAGYKTEVFRDILYENCRPIGRYSVLKGWKRQGLGAYRLRYSFLYLLFKTGHDVFRPPYLLGSMYYLSGYLTAFLQKKEPILTKEQGKLIRRLFWKSFFERLKKRQFFLLQPFNRKQ